MWGINFKIEKNTRDVIQFGDSKGEEDVLIKRQNYEIKTLIAICNDMEKKFAKSQKNNVCNSLFEMGI